MRKEILISFDDYSPYNETIADLLLKYNLPAIFFIECNHSKHLSQISRLSRNGFEIGGHTVNHSILRGLDKEDMEFEINECKKRIEDITGKDCKWFAYPRGRHDEKVRKAVKDAGFEKVRTTLVLNNKMDDHMQLSTTVHALDGRKEYKDVSWYDVATIKLEIADTFHLWGHANEIIEKGYLKDLERIFELLSYKYESLL